ncbi:MAG TPA: DUF1573 domain-containing protein [Chitinophagaceae bacterium]|nr:DUF1573 domain-containing protein [Chitinophagaceae bacterium]
MKRIFLLFASAAIIWSCQNQAQDKQADVADADQYANAMTDTANFTTIQWLDSARDMGKIKEGEKVEIAFRFRNAGNKPLIIKNVTPSCGCTVADFPKQPLKPGEEGVIKGVFDSNGRPGVNNKIMTVSANTTGVQNHTISFMVDVQKKD